MEIEWRKGNGLTHRGMDRQWKGQIGREVDRQTDRQRLWSWDIKMVCKY